jgi:hypothetical protein
LLPCNPYEKRRRRNCRRILQAYSRPPAFPAGCSGILAIMPLRRIGVTVFAFFRLPRYTHS